MGVIKSIIAFLLGIIFLLLFYYFVSIPVLPCITLYVPALLFSSEKDKGYKMRKVFTLILAIVGTSLYAINTYMIINTYPSNGNIVAVVFELLNVFSFIGAGLFLNSTFIITANKQKSNIS